MSQTVGYHGQTFLEISCHDVAISTFQTSISRGVDALAVRNVQAYSPCLAPIRRGVQVMRIRASSAYSRRRRLRVELTTCDLHNSGAFATRFLNNALART